MTLITPVGGSNFNWAPQKSGFTKQASSGASENTGKDALFEAAKKVMAQFELDNKPPCDDVPCDKASVVDSKPVDPVMPDTSVTPASDTTSASDAVKVVSDLVEKCDKAEQVSSAVADAVSNVEVALQGVKDAVGVSDVSTDETEVEVVESEDDSEAEPSEEVEEVEIEFEEGDEEGNDDLPPGNLEGEGDEIVKEGDEEGDEGEEENPFEKSAASKGTFVKISEISPENKKKVYSYWKDMLGYPEDFCKLMVKNYEK